MLRALNITGVQEQVLAKYLRQYLGKGVVPARRGVSMLADGHSEVHVDKIQWKYSDDKKEETVEWSEKKINKEIEIQLARELKGRGVTPSDVYKVQAVIGGDHGDTAFQFGAAITAILNDNTRVYFEIIVAELICRKDSSALLEKTILPGLTAGLKIIAEDPLHIYSDDHDNSLKCAFAKDKPTTTNHPSTSLWINIFVTGDLAFQAMVLGREDMSGQHCLMCQLSRSQFINKAHPAGSPWTYTKLKCCGEEAAKQTRKKHVHGVKQEPWWPFLNFDHHVVPLLHCEIGIGNNLLDKFCHVVNAFIESKSNEEIKIMRELTSYDQIINDTIKERDAFDKNEEEGKKLNSLKSKIKRYKKKISAGDEADDDDDDDDADNNDDNDNNNIPDTISANTTDLMQLSEMEKELEPLMATRKEMADKLKRARALLSDKQKALRRLQSVKKKKSESLETQIFKLLKEEAGVELTSYHGGSLTGKDIKKVMEKATYLFNEFSSILKTGKGDDCKLTDDDIDRLCHDFMTAFVLWDGAFSIARKCYPTPTDVNMYQRYVDAAVDMHVKLGLNITPKVHLMYKHVAMQMETIEGGLGDKMEDWIEKAHQWGKRLRARFRTMRNLQKRANAKQRIDHRDSDPAVVKQSLEVDKASKRKFTGDDKETVEESREQERRDKRMRTLEEYEAEREAENPRPPTFLSEVLLSAAAMPVGDGNDEGNRGD